MPHVDINMYNRK